MSAITAHVGDLVDFDHPNGLRLQGILVWVSADLTQGAIEHLFPNEVGHRLVRQTTVSLEKCSIVFRPVRPTREDQ